MRKPFRCERTVPGTALPRVERRTPEQSEDVRLHGAFGSHGASPSPAGPPREKTVTIGMLKSQHGLPILSCAAVLSEKSTPPATAVRKASQLREYGVRAVADTHSGRLAFHRHPAGGRRPRHRSDDSCSFPLGAWS
jgi:hypothetical protein